MYQSDIRHDNQALAQKLQSLYGLNRAHGLDLSFRPAYLDLLEKFGNPHHDLPPTLHIAGTNGKGSTLAILRSCLESMGLRVHVYTSPHLVQFNERIVLAGQMIADNDLESLVDEALAHNGDTDISFFEITTAMAFAAFARTPADVVLLETGLGGRLDCTNVIQAPLATLISPIGIDHQDYLGETLADIAGEKAGIIKSHCPVILGKQPHDDALSVITRTAQSCNSDMILPDHHWTCERIDSQTMRFTWQDDITITLPTPSLDGDHQIDNAGLALATLYQLRSALGACDQRQLSAAMQSITWPARMQNITGGLPAGSADKWSLWLDGGHNADAAAILCAHIQNWKRQSPDAEIHLICAMMGHKDARSFLTPLRVEANSITFVPLSHEPCASTPQDLQNAIPDTPCTISNSVQAAIDDIISAHANGHILICGSLYLAGDVLQRMGIQA